MINTTEALTTLASKAGIWSCQWTNAPDQPCSHSTVLVAGVDEAGRGALIGPVACAAVILDLNNPVAGLNDSKKLTAKKRAQLFELICTQALAVNLVLVDAPVIDRINILQATLFGMKLSVEGLTLEPSLVRIDGNKAPELDVPVETHVKGDANFEEIAAASIVAKVGRDTLIEALALTLPEFELAKHKGYPTKQHQAELMKHGASSYHRSSFAPVARALGLNPSRDKPA